MFAGLGGVLRLHCICLFLCPPIGLKKSVSNAWGGAGGFRQSAKSTAYVGCADSLGLPADGQTVSTKSAQFTLTWNHAPVFYPNHHPLLTDCAKCSTPSRLP